MTDQFFNPLRMWLPNHEGSLIKIFCGQCSRLSLICGEYILGTNRVGGKGLKIKVDKMKLNSVSSGLVFISSMIPPSWSSYFSLGILQSTCLFLKKRTGTRPGEEGGLFGTLPM